MSTQNSRPRTTPAHVCDRSRNSAKMVITWRDIAKPIHRFSGSVAMSEVDELARGIHTRKSVSIRSRSDASAVCLACDGCLASAPGEHSRQIRCPRNRARSGTLRASHSSSSGGTIRGGFDNANRRSPDELSAPFPGTVIVSPLRTTIFNIISDSSSHSPGSCDQ